MGSTEARLSSSVIIAIVVAIVALLLLAGGLFIMAGAVLFLIRGRRKKATAVEPKAAPRPDPKPAPAAPKPAPAPAATPKAAAPAPDGAKRVVGAAPRQPDSPAPLTGGIVPGFFEDPDEQESAMTEIFSRPKPGKALWDDEDDDDEADKTELFTPSMLEDFEGDMGALLDGTPVAAPKRNDS